MRVPERGNDQTLTALYERAWNDTAVAACLEHDPLSAIAEYFGKLPADIEVWIVRDTPDVKHLYIPAAPLEREIDEPT